MIKDIHTQLEDYVETSLSKAVHLVLLGYKIKKVERIDMNKVKFIFPHVSEKDLLSYYQEEERFSVKRVFLETRNLKDKIHNTNLQL